MANFFTNIIDKIKSIFNIGSLSLELVVPSELKRTEIEIPGKVIITAKKDKIIKEVEFSFSEVWEKGKAGSEGYINKRFDLGKQVTNMESRELKTGDTQEVSFLLPFHLNENLNDELKKHGGAIGALGKFGSFLDQEKSTFWFTVSVSTEGNTFPVTKAQIIKMV